MSRLFCVHRIIVLCCHTFNLTFLLSINISLALKFMIISAVLVDILSAILLRSPHYLVNVSAMISMKLWLKWIIFLVLTIFHQLLNFIFNFGTSLSLPHFFFSVNCSSFSGVGGIVFFSFKTAKTVLRFPLYLLLRKKCF